MNGLSVWHLWAVAGVVAALALYVYLSLRIELRLQARRGVTRAEWEADRRAWVAEVEALRNRLAEAEARTAAPPAHAGQPLNLNRHGQILRLHGRGRSVAEIAADLQIAQGEVDLLLRMHESPGHGAADWVATTRL